MVFIFLCSLVFLSRKQTMNLSYIIGWRAANAHCFVYIVCYIWAILVNTFFLLNLINNYFSGANNFVFFVVIIWYGKIVGAPEMVPYRIGYNFNLLKCWKKVVATLRFIIQYVVSVRKMTNQTFGIFSEIFKVQ